MDWVEIASFTERHTNFQTGAEKTTGHSWLPEGKDSYVQALEKGAGGRATVFRFRIYDPKNWQQVMSIARKLCEYFHDARELLAQGIDPGENRKAQKATKQNRAANSFEVVAREWYAKSSPSWTQAHGRALLLVVSSGTFFRESESCAVCRLFCQTTEPERKVLPASQAS